MASSVFGKTTNGTEVAEAYRDQIRGKHGKRLAPLSICSLPSRTFHSIRFANLKPKPAIANPSDYSSPPLAGHTSDELAYSAHYGLWSHSSSPAFPVLSLDPKNGHHLIIHGPIQS